MIFMTCVPPLIFYFIGTERKSVGWKCESGGKRIGKLRIIFAVLSREREREREKSGKTQ